MTKNIKDIHRDPVCIVVFLLLYGGVAMADNQIVNFSNRYAAFYNAVLATDFKGLQEYSVFSEQAMNAQVPAMIEMMNKLPEADKKQASEKMASFGIHSVEELREPAKAFAALVKPIVLSEYP